jgi:hypothetical protein
MLTKTFTISAGTFPAGATVSIFNARTPGTVYTTALIGADATADVVLPIEAEYIATGAGRTMRFYVSPSIEDVFLADDILCKRNAAGDLVPIAASATSGLMPSVSPDDFGATGDGITDDSQALQDALDELATLPGLGGWRVLTLTGRYRVTEQPTTLNGAGTTSSPWLDPVHGLHLTTAHSYVVVRFMPGAAILMDNQKDAGGGLRWGGHGLFFDGGVHDVVVIDAEIGSTTAFDSMVRANTYAPISALSSQDANTHPVDETLSPRRILFSGRTKVYNSSGTGYNGFRTSDVYFDYLDVSSTKADGCHNHACRRTNGNMLLGLDCEDDTLAFQAYGWTATAFRDGPGLQAQYYDCPTGLAVTNIGAAGAVAYEYFVAAVFSDETRIPSDVVTTATGNATLDGTNYNRIAFTGVTGAVGYELYGRQSGGEHALLAYATSTPLQDQGAVGGDTFPKQPVQLSEWCNADSGWQTVIDRVSNYVADGRAIPSVSEFWARTIGIGMGRDIHIGRVVSIGKNAAVGVRSNPYNGSSGFNYYPSRNITIGEIDAVDSWFGPIRFYGQNMPWGKLLAIASNIGAGAVTSIVVDTAVRLPAGTKINVTNDAGTVVTCTVSSDMAASSTTVPISSVTIGVTTAGGVAPLGNAVVQASQWAKVYGYQDVTIGKIRSRLTRTQVPYQSTGSTTNASTTLTLTGTVPVNLSPDVHWGVSGAGIASGTYVTGVSGSTITLSDPATATASGVAIKFTWCPSHRGIFIGTGGTNNQASLGAAGKVNSAVNSWLDGTRLDDVEMLGGGLQVYNSKVSIGRYYQRHGIFRLTNDAWTSSLDDLRPLGSAFGEVVLEACTIDLFYQSGVKFDLIRGIDQPCSNIFGSAADGGVDYAFNQHDMDHLSIKRIEMIRPNRHKRAGTRVLSFSSSRRLTVGSYLVDTDTPEATQTALYVASCRDSVIGDEESLLICDGATQPAVSINGVSGGRSALVSGWRTARTATGSSAPIKQWIVQSDINTIGSSQLFTSGQRCQDNVTWRMFRFEHYYGSGNQWREENGRSLRINPGDAAYACVGHEDVLTQNTVLTATRTWTLPPLTSVRPGYTLLVQTGDLGGFALKMARAGADPIDRGSGPVYLTENDNVYWFTNTGSRWVWGQVLTPLIDFNAQTGTTYTPVYADAAPTREVELANAGTITVTLPTDASLDVPIGSRVVFRQTGAGAVVFANAGGVTVNSKAGFTSGTTQVSSRWGRVTATKRAANSWVLDGDLT